jgi:hypothetical protein
MKRFYNCSLVIGVIAFLLSCSYTSCDELAANFKNEEQFHMVLIKKENNNSRNTYLYGIDLNTKEKVTYLDGSGWLEDNFEKFKIGDTLIKDLGKYSIVIKRNGKTILIPCVCDRYGKFIGDTNVHRIYYDTVLKK